ncbi:MAG: PduL/EutD family phosphate acyltransferase [Spirochaetia bacterium]|jgi:putative phosphotransacetylase|nr:PduL/EutD family phosphate acyltransferase [Spirochaetia bacterium]
MRTQLPIARSDIHIHLTENHIEELFGKGYKLTKWFDLTIPGQFACNERVTVSGKEGTIEDVVVVGPARDYTQLEISFTNGSTLGIIPVLRDSGDIEGTPGVVAARRHIHMHTKDAEDFGVKDRQIVKIKVPGLRGLIFDKVLVRVNPDNALEMHITGNYDTQ